MSNATAHFVQKDTSSDVANLDLLRIFLHDDANALTSRRPSVSQWFDFFNSEAAWQTSPAAWHQLGANLASFDIASANIAVTKPLLLLFMCGAERCCEVALDSLDAKELLAIREPVGNCLHALVIGCRSKLRPKSAFEALLTRLAARLTADELRSLHVSYGFELEFEFEFEI